MTDPCIRSNERRSFLRKGLTWFSLAALTALVYPLVRFLHFNVPKKPRHVMVNKFPGEGDVFLDPDFALFNSAEEVWAVSRKCTHLGCRLNYSEKDHLLICPCHQSRFTAHGKRLEGPARKNLLLYQVESMEGESGKTRYMVTL